MVQVAADWTAPVAEAAAQSDATLLIAPECDGILENLITRIAGPSIRLLGAPAGAVRLCGDKLALGRHFAARGVPTPPVGPAAEGPPRPGRSGAAAALPQRGRRGPAAEGPPWPCHRVGAAALP